MRQILADIGRHRGLVAVTVFQAVCAVLFLVDVLGELDEFVSNPIHPLVEFTAIAALLTCGDGCGRRAGPSSSSCRKASAAGA